jgi:microsomal dipeptidase-like Zn-dependent dipeptidase
VSSAARLALACSALALLGSAPGGSPGSTSIQVVVQLPAANASGGAIGGYADLHMHQFGEYAFAGAWLHGSATGNEPGAVPACDGGGPASDHGRVDMPALNPFFDLLFSEALTNDAGRHPGRTAGFPAYAGWPAWDSLAHQQVWEGWVHQAHLDGMQLMVMSATTFEPLCERMPPETRAGHTCEDMAIAIEQIDAANAWDAVTPWVEVALTPADARRIIASGKLAIVLAIEVTELFPSSDWRAELDDVYARGVRSIQPTHQLNNDFAGAAPHHFIFRYFQMEQDGIDAIANPNTAAIGTQIGFDYDENDKNLLGLTEQGKDLVRELMDRNMVVDIAHLSERAVADTFEIAEANHFYPLLISHGHLREAMTHEKQKEEKTVPAWQIRMVRQTGGMLGLRSGPEPVLSFFDSGVVNDCLGSSKSFAQAYTFGRQMLGVDIGFAMDFNGFAENSAPRYGDETGNAQDGCSGALTRRQRRCQQQAQLDADRTGQRMDTMGVGRIDDGIDLIGELNHFGVNTGNLMESAENFIRVWERGYAVRSPAALPANPAVVSTANLLPVTSAGCRGVFRECKHDCRVTRRGCKQDCREDKRECTQTCRTIKGACSTSCVSEKAQCKAACAAAHPGGGKALRKCNSGCRKDKRSCKKTCREDKRECKQTCRDVKGECKDDCSNASNGCFDLCISHNAFCRSSSCL